MGFDHCEQTCDLKPDPQTFSSLGLAARENSEARTMRRAPSQRGSEDWKQNEGDCVIGIPSVRWQSAPLVGFKPIQSYPTRYSLELSVWPFRSLCLPSNTEETAIKNALHFLASGRKDESFRNAVVRMPYKHACRFTSLPSSFAHRHRVK